MIKAAVARMMVLPYIMVWLIVTVECSFQANAQSASGAIFLQLCNLEMSKTDCVKQLLLI